MKKNIKYSSDEIRRLTVGAMLFATALVLSIIENSLPPLPLPIIIPGVKLGLSNIPVMYSLFFIGNKSAIVIAVLKSAFVAITRGVVAGLLSFSGGLLSVIVMALLIFIFKEHISYLVISIFGAVFHNIGQFIAVSFLYTNLFGIVYLPVLLVSGLAAGIVTSLLLKFVLPALKRLGIK